VDRASFGRQCRRRSRRGSFEQPRPHAKEAMGPESVTFHAADGLPVSADLHSVPKARAFLVLCHRSHFHRGEYVEIAPRLAQLGYDCLAIDQRSGMNVLGRVNETCARAKERKLATGYVAARPDIEAAVQYTRDRCRRRPIVLVGSSYSASLSLVIASEETQLSAVAAFSPGDYLKGIVVADAVAGLSVSTFVTAAQKEVPDTRELVKRAQRGRVTFHSPRHEGAHGARCLWAKTPGSAEYWKAFLAFLEGAVEKA
jgi:alpha-beta hydrolase superfamily lysophospholipase